MSTGDPTSIPGISYSGSLYVDTSQVGTLSPTLSNTIVAPTNSYGFPTVDDLNKIVERLNEIENRLNILPPNTAIEAEWEELQKLGDQYRALELHILEKQRTWEILNRK